MKISQDIRDAAGKQNEVDAGFQEMADRFKAAGGEVYVKDAAV